MHSAVEPAILYNKEFISDEGDVTIPQRVIVLEGRKVECLLVKDPVINFFNFIDASYSEQVDAAHPINQTKVSATSVVRLSIPVNLAQLIENKARHQWSMIDRLVKISRRAFLLLRDNREYHEFKYETSSIQTAEIVYEDQSCDWCQLVKVPQRNISCLFKRDKAKEYFDIIDAGYGPSPYQNFFDAHGIVHRQFAMPTFLAKSLQRLAYGKLECEEMIMQINQAAKDLFFKES